VRRRRHRRCKEKLPSLGGSAGRHHVRRIVVGKLSAQQMPLHGEDALGLLDLALSNRTGMRQRPVRMALRHAEQHERQQHEKPRQDRARSSRPVLPHRAMARVSSLSRPDIGHIARQHRHADSAPDHRTCQQKCGQDQRDGDHDRQIEGHEPRGDRDRRDQRGNA
jgi:hypothetical protein